MQTTVREQVGKNLRHLEHPLGGPGDRPDPLSQEGERSEIRSSYGHGPSIEHMFDTCNRDALKSRISRSPGRAG